MDKVFFRTDILSKTGILMKLTKNLITVESKLPTRCSIKKIITMMWHPPHSPCPHKFAFWWTPLPLWVNVIIECPLIKSSTWYNEFQKKESPYKTGNTSIQSRIFLLYDFVWNFWLKITCKMLQLNVLKLILTL